MPNRSMIDWLFNWLTIRLTNRLVYQLCNRQTNWLMYYWLSDKMNNWSETHKSQKGLTNWHIGWLTDWCTDCPTQTEKTCIDCLTEGLTEALALHETWLTDLSMHWLLTQLTACLTDWLTDWLTDCLVNVLAVNRNDWLTCQCIDC